MSGHSKWSTIKHQKAVEDSKRSAVFTKLAKKIKIAVQKGSSADINTNASLRAVVEEARSANMPMENIKRAIDRATGMGEAKTEEVVYEAYGINGLGIMITTITDNRNRTAAEVKNMLEKNDAKLASVGSVSYLKGLSPFPTVELDVPSKAKMDKLVEVLLGNDDVVDVWTNLEK